MTTTKTTTKTEPILNKLKPCGCGCHGSDPWHKATYRRVVTITSSTTGTVKLPYSTKPVRVTRHDYGEGVFGCWIVDVSSIDFDK